MTLGFDFSAVTDIDGTWTRASSEELAYLQAIARRLITPPGGLFYAEDYGLGLLNFVNAPVSAFRIERAIETEALKDERTLTASAQVTFVEASQALSIALELDSDEGPFELTIDATALTVEILATNTDGYLIEIT